MCQAVRGLLSCRRRVRAVFRKSQVVGSFFSGSFGAGRERQMACNLPIYTYILMAQVIFAVPRIHEGFDNMKEGTLGLEGGPGAQLQPYMDESLMH